MMKSIINRAGKMMVSLTVLLIFSGTSILSARDYYQIKVYQIKDKTQEATIEKYLKNAYLPALHRSGIKKVGVFKPIETDATAGTRIFVFIPLKKLSQVETLENALLKDIQYQKDGTEYMDASWNNPPYVRMESILLKAFSEMPQFHIPDHATPPFGKNL